ncbi:MAG: hypothetical protein QW156_02035 [Candidatus Aenigmatarchaeota archaeon]
MPNFLKELNYLKEVYQLEPGPYLLYYLNSDSNIKLEWLNKVEGLRTKIASDSEISSFRRELLLKRINSYIEKLNSGNQNSNVFKNSSNDYTKDLWPAILTFSSGGLLGFFLGWFARGYYDKAEEERYKRIAEMVLKKLRE